MRLTIRSLKGGQSGRTDECQVVMAAVVRVIIGPSNVDIARDELLSP